MTQRHVDLLIDFAQSLQREARATMLGPLASQQFEKDAEKMNGVIRLVRELAAGNLVAVPPDRLAELEADEKCMTVLRNASTAFLFSNSGGYVTAVIGPASTERVQHVTTHGANLNKAIANAYDAIVPLSQSTPTAASTKEGE